MILIVEDNLDDSFLLTRQLARAGLGDQIRLIGDGLDALEFLLHTPAVPTALFLDLQLPGLSGMELLQSIRADPRLHTLPVVIMTHSVDPQLVDLCTELGVTAYLPKPVGLQLFTKIVGKLSESLPLFV